MRPTFITLTTDFGTRDTYVAQMKGIIATLAPDARVIDVTHEIAPQDVLEAALAIDGIVDAFPPGTVHVAVVDPGVGTDRRAVAIGTAAFTLIGPDNGLFAPALQRYPGYAAVALDPARLPPRPVSATFHGRDLFAPAAARLAAGADLEILGEPLDPDSLVRLDLPSPRVEADHVVAHVLHVDRFGNLITDLTEAAWQRCRLNGQRVELRVGDGGAAIHGLGRTFADVAESDPVAYFGSGGRLEIAVRNGSAAERFAAGRGARVILRPASAPAPSSTR